MSPRLERELAMDDTADFAQSMHGPAVLTMTTPALLAEVESGLAMRVMRQRTTVRDVMLVQALAARLQTATISHALATRSANKEPLEGMLVLGDIETSDAAPTLSFTEFESRRAS